MRRLLSRYGGDMEIREINFDDFFGKPIPKEGFTIEDIVKEVFGDGDQPPLDTTATKESGTEGSGPEEDKSDDG